MVINCAEIAVRELFPEVLKSYQQRIGPVCTCQRCLDDVVALTLNYLPPHYVASEKGTIITGVDYQQVGGRTEIFTRLYKSIGIVAENPRH